MAQFFSHLLMLFSSEEQQAKPIEAVKVTTQLERFLWQTNIFGHHTP